MNIRIAEKQNQKTPYRPWFRKPLAMETQDMKAWAKTAFCSGTKLEILDDAGQVVDTVTVVN